MIAVDTSALLCILLDEPEAERCIDALASAANLVISAGTLAEALIVAGRRGIGDEMEQMLDGLGVEVVSLSHGSARRVAQAYARWGKGVHPAGLNLGDCFSYELAHEHGCPLLYVGDDFTRTDLEPA